jgi:hypothetical protein
VLQWNSSFDGPWSREAVRRYREGGFDGLSLAAGGGWTPVDLDFVTELPGLRMLDVQAKVRNDLAPFHVTTLEDLTLVTGSRLAVPDMVQPALRRLCLTERPGLEIAARWPELDWFRLGTWRGTDLRMLDGAAWLSTVSIEGRRQAGSLEGVETCGALENLTVINYSVRDTELLRALDNLVEVKLLAARPTGPHGRIDVADLPGDRLAKLWIANATELSNIETLAGLPALRELRLIECGLTGSDQRVLAALPRRVQVRIVTGTTVTGRTRGET